MHNKIENTQARIVRRKLGGGVVFLVDGIVPVQNRREILFPVVDIVVSGEVIDLPSGR